MGKKYTRMDHVKLAEDSFQKIRTEMVSFNRPHKFRFFTVCLSQILNGPLFNPLVPAVH